MESLPESICTGRSDSEGDVLEGLSRENRLQFLADFWSELSTTGETGATDRATLDELEREVTEVMYEDEPDIFQAESLTYRAFHLIAGNI